MPDYETTVVDFGSIFHIEQLNTDGPYSEYVEDVRDNPEHLLQWFKSGGVDQAVLADPYFVGHHDDDVTREVNDDLYEVVSDYEEYYGFAALPVRAGSEVAAREFERCLDRGYNGGGITPTAGELDMTDPIYEPVFEVADRTGAPLLVHPTAHPYLDESEPDGYVFTGKYQSNHMFGRESRLCASILKVINAGVLDRYPNLNLVYHHHGGNIASMIGRVDLRMTHGTDETKPFDEVKEQMEDRIYIDTSGYYGYAAPTRMAIEQFPVSNIVFATDSPAEAKTPAELQDYVNTIWETAPRTEARRILGQNARDLMVNL